MRYIITTEQDIKENQIEGYTYCTSLSELAELSVNNICDGLVVHSMNDKVSSGINNLQEIIKSTKADFTINKADNTKVYYINSTPTPNVKVLLKSYGLENCIELTDEFYLSEKDELDALFEEDYSLSVSDYTSDGKEAIMKVINSQSNGKPLQQYEIEQAIVAISEMEKMINTYKVGVDNLVDVSTRLFTTHSKAIKTLCGLIKKQQENAENLKNKVRETAPTLSARDNMGIGAVQYNTVTLSPDVTTHTKILYIKEYSYCKYLASALYLYRRYLSIKHKLRTKIIFVVQKGQDIYAKYNQSMTCLSDSNKRVDPELYTATMEIMINNPTMVHMKNLLSGNNANLDVIIVMDRLYGSPILQSTSVNFKTLNAVGSHSDYELFKSRLVQSKTITSLNEINNQNGEYFANIPRLIVPSSESRLTQLYTTKKPEDKEEPFYNKLNNFLGLEVSR